MPRYVFRPLLMAVRSALVGSLFVVGASSGALAQEQRTDRNAFSWNARIGQGNWIQVRNLNGTINVERATGDRVEVTATKRWRESDPGSVRFEVKRYGSGDQSAVICAVWGDRTTCDENEYSTRGGTRNNDVSVQFTVRVPAGVRVRVSSVNGGVEVEGTTAEVHASSVNGSVRARSTGGPVHASSVNGSVTASMGRFTLDDDLSFSSVNGAVRVEFTDLENADVEMSTMNGSASTDFPLTVQGRFNPRSIRGTIGRGGPRVKLSTINGSVELRKR